MIFENEVMKLSNCFWLLTWAISPLAFSHADHSHGVPLSEKEISAAKGVFATNDVKDRPLSDWDGVWQSIYPYAKDGSLDIVFRSKADKDHSQSFEQVKKYYLKGYASDITEIGIENGVIEFTINGKISACRYDYQGYKILNYSSGKRGVRYLFLCKDKQSSAPRFVQFSDHIISPKPSTHFHIFTGNVSQAALLKELENWPTFFPFQLKKQEVIDDLLYH